VRTAGLQPASLRGLEELVITVRALCQGLPVARADGGEMRLVYGRPGACPPLVIGASGARMLTLAGAVADGVVIGGANLSHETLRMMIACVEEGRRAAGRLDQPFTTYLAPPAAIDDDVEAAFAAVRPHVALSVQKEHWPASPDVVAARERVRGMYDLNQHLKPQSDHSEKSLFPDSVVAQFALAGTGEEVARRCAEIFKLGIDEIVIRPYAVGTSTRLEAIERFAEGVMPFYA
jgi:alkanesulfonate monooxygenase SsuD/methylene tetrahydromethanopterin reductase-like flavin-dependent oxidoreductase (luciferase family)